MTEIEELMKAARLSLKRHRKPVVEGVNDKTWQEMLDRPYGRMEIKY